MQVGKLYKICNYTAWSIPRGADPDSGYRFWLACGPILYLGVENVQTNEDGTTTQTHAIWVKGRRRIVEERFLRHFRPLTPS